jgi:tRNA(Ile)-lysidine synthase
MRKVEPSYPKPGPVGGRLIRQLIKSLRDQGVELPLDPNTSSHILCAVSGGSDSVALLHLLAKYGRRVVSRDQIIALHINQGWRGEESEKDARFVESLAEDLGVQFRLEKLKVRAAEGESWENVARSERKAIYSRVTSGGLSWVLTAQHADDLAETVLWRVLTGNGDRAGGGILLRDGRELRPFLRIRKAELIAYLQEERVNWREDSTNREGRFLRSRMRQKLMPLIEDLFPQAIRNLTERALELQKAAGKDEDFNPEWLLQMTGARLKRAHFDSLKKGVTELHLPGGWKMIRKPSRSAAEQWTLVKAPKRQ